MILLYNNYRSLSISSREGIEFAVPIFVVDRPAVALANLRASLSAGMITIPCSFEFHKDHISWRGIKPLK